MEKYIDVQIFYQAEKERCGGCEPMIGSCSSDNVSLRSRLDKTPNVSIPHMQWEKVQHGADLFSYSFKCGNCGKETPIGAYPISPNFCAWCGFCDNPAIKYVMGSGNHD